MEHKVAIVDDHHIVRNGLVTMVNAMPGYTVCLEAANGKAFIKALENNTDSIPDVAIVDLHMPVMDGFETIRWLSGQRPGIKALVLTLDVTEDAMIRATRMGARGFIRKNSRPDVLKTALDSIRLTGYFYTDEIHRSIRQNPTLQTRVERKRADVLSQITPRELEFLRYVCHTDELTYEQIADKMNISRRTVDHFRQELFEKFHIRSKVGLVLFALKWELVKLSDGN